MCNLSSTPTFNNVYAKGLLAFYSFFSTANSYYSDTGPITFLLSCALIKYLTCPADPLKLSYYLSK